MTDDVTPLYRREIAAQFPFGALCPAELDEARSIEFLMTTARKWTVNEDSRLKKMRAGGKTAAVIAKALNRTEAAIFSRSSYLGRNGAISRKNRAAPGFWPVLGSRNREMSERHLKQVEGHLARSERHISRQVDIVTKLERDGHEKAAKTARELLRIFRQTLQYQLDNRDRLRAELSALS